MLSPHLDLPALRQAYAQNGAAVINNILRPDIAQRLLSVMQELPWTLEISGRDTSRTLRVPMPDSRINPKNLLSAIDRIENDLDIDDLFFVRMVHEPEFFEHPLLLEFQAFLNTPAFIQPMMQMTGRFNISHTYISATCYERNCFLGAHRDDQNNLNSVALVFNLTPEWYLDWGGHLILNLPGKGPMLVPPGWNSLSIMNVPVDHMVSSISPTATGKRYALTGWLRN